MKSRQPNQRRVVVPYTLEDYNKYCEVYSAEIKTEQFNDEQVWDLAKSILDCPSPADERAIAFLKSENIKELVGRLADDINIGHH